MVVTEGDIKEDEDEEDEQLAGDRGLVDNGKISMLNCFWASV
jgi:hypothetical protein